MNNITTQNEKLVNAFNNGSERSIRNDSIVHNLSGERGIISKWIYYNTIIFEHYNNDEYYKISNGGYNTASTKQRINDIVSELTNDRFYIQQKDFEWFLNDRETKDSIIFNANFKLYYNLKSPLTKV